MTVVLNTPVDLSDKRIKQSWAIGTEKDKSEIFNCVHDRRWECKTGVAQTELSDMHGQEFGQPLSYGKSKKHLIRARDRLVMGSSMVLEGVREFSQPERYS